VAGLHAFAHLSQAITLLLLLELAVETCIRWGSNPRPGRSSGPRDRPTVAAATGWQMSKTQQLNIQTLVVETKSQTKSRTARYEGLGADGPHSLYRWFTAYEEEHFPDPAGLRRRLSGWTLGLYPGLIKAAMVGCWGVVLAAAVVGRVSGRC
jgi:hypothetical protein